MTRDEKYNHPRGVIRLQEGLFDSPVVRPRREMGGTPWPSLWVASPDPTWQVAVGAAGGTRLYSDLFPVRLSSPQTITRPLWYLVHILSLGKSRNTPVVGSPDAARHRSAISRAQMIWILYVYICAWRGRGSTHRARGTYWSVAVNIETDGDLVMLGVYYKVSGSNRQRVAERTAGDLSEVISVWPVWREAG